MPLLISGGLFCLAILGLYSLFLLFKKFKAYRDAKMSKLDAKEADRAKYREEELKRMYWVCVMKGKIVVTFFQIVLSFGGIFTVPYPASFTAFLSYFNVLNLGILNFFSTGCLLERDYYNDLAVVTLIPLMITVAMAVMYRIQTRRALSLEDKLRNKKSYISYFLMLLFFIYTGVTSAIFQVFQVRKFDDGYSYLVMDMSMRTDDKRYKEMAAYAIGMVIVYPIGIIFINAGALWINKCYMWNSRDVLCNLAPVLCRRFHVHNEDPENHKPLPDEDGVVDSLDFLVGAYSPKFWWFEVFELMRKLVLTGVFSLILPNTDTQITLGCLVCVGSFYFYTDVKPYINRSDNHLAIFAQFGSFMVLYSGLVMKMQMLYKPDMQGGIADAGWLGWFLVGITASFPIVGMYCAIAVHACAPHSPTLFLSPAAFFIVRDVLYPEHLLTKEQKRRKMLMEMTDEQKIMEFRTLFDHYDKSDNGWLPVKLVRGMLLGSSVGWEEDTLEEKFMELGIAIEGQKQKKKGVPGSGGDGSGGKGGLGTKRVVFDKFYVLMAGEALNEEIYETIHKHLMRAKTIAAEEKKLKKKPPPDQDFDLFVVHDDSKSLPENVKLIISGSGMDVFKNTTGGGEGGFDEEEEEDDFMDMADEGADSFTSLHWEYVDMKKCKASKQSKDNRDMELFNIQIDTKIFIFECEHASEVKYSARTLYAPTPQSRHVFLYRYAFHIFCLQIMDAIKKQMDHKEYLKTVKKEIVERQLREDMEDHAEQEKLNKKETAEEKIQKALLNLDLLGEDSSDEEHDSATESDAGSATSASTDGSAVVKQSSGSRRLSKGSSGSKLSSRHLQNIDTFIDSSDSEEDEDTDTGVDTDTDSDAEPLMRLLPADPSALTEANVKELNELSASAAPAAYGDLPELLNNAAGAPAAEGGKSGRMECYMYEDPTGQLEDEMELIVSTVGLQFMKQAGGEQICVFTWKSLKKIWGDPPSEDPDDLDLFYMELAGEKIKISCECINWAAIENAIAKYRGQAANDSALQVQNQKIVL
jgi:hypothetical protein